MKNTLEI